MDLKTGGELNYHLNRRRFTIEQVVFYAAQVNEILKIDLTGFRSFTLTWCHLQRSKTI